MPRKYTVKDTQTGKSITFSWDGSDDPTDADFEEVFAEARKSFTPNTQRQPLKPTTAGASTTGTIASSPFAKQYQQQAAGERGDIAKNVISFGLPFLATGLTAGAAIPAAGALAATGEALGTKVGDVIAGRRTPNEEVISSSLGAGIGGLAGEGIGRGLVGLTGKALTGFSRGYDPQIDALAKRYGMTLPASASTTNRAVPLLESISGKSLFGNKLTQMTIDAETKLTKIADDFISKIDATPDASSAGIKIADGMKNYEQTFRATKNSLYDLAKIKKGDVAVKPTSTIKVIDEIIGDINNSANPNMAELSYFQRLRDGLSGGDETEAFVAKTFPPQVLEAMKKQGKFTASSGVDGTTVLNTVRNLNRKVNFNSADPISTGYQGELKRIAATLSDEFDTALATSKPEMAEALARANATYKEGIGKLNSTYGKKIKKLSDAGQYDKIADAILNKSTSVDDIPKIFEVVGEDGKNALRSNLAKNILGDAKRNAKQVFTPSIIDKTLKQVGDARLKAIYTPEEYNALKEISKLTYAVGAAQRVAEGSQTTFTAKMSGIIASVFFDPLTSLKLLMGDAAVASAIASKGGQRLLRGGFKLPQYVSPAVSTATRTAGQFFGNK